MADCGGIPTFEDGQAPVREIHVSPAGNDSSGDGSPTNPYGTIGYASRQATAGTAMRIHPGTYPSGGWVENLVGRPDAPIWIGGLPGAERPRLTGTEGLHLSTVTWVVVHDLEVAGNAANGINTDDGGRTGEEVATHHIVFRNLDIHDVGGSGNQDCLKLSGIRDFVVRDSTFARCGGGFSGSGIDMVGAHRGLIARNTFREMSGNAIQAKGGAADIEMRWNHLIDPGERGFNLGGSTGFEFFRPPLDAASPNAEARRLKVIANIVEGGTTPMAFVGCVDCLAANNTIVSPRRWLLRILQETTTTERYTFEPSRDGRLVNNLFVFERGALATDVNVGPNTAPDTFVFENNLWFARDNPARSAPSLPGTETGSIAGRDPAFTDGFQIGANSPAFAAGVAVPGLVGDFSGRCYGSPPSIGAHEAP